MLLPGFYFQLLPKLSEFSPFLYTVTVCHRLTINCVHVYSPRLDHPCSYLTWFLGKRFGQPPIAGSAGWGELGALIVRKAGTQYKLVMTLFALVPSIAPHDHLFYRQQQHRQTPEPS